MPVNCTQCGAHLEPGQRFCSDCGAPVESAPLPREDKPDLDLSAYFDDARGGAGSTASRPERMEPISVTRPPRTAPAKPARPRTESAKASRGKEKTAAAEKSDRGLNLALLICGMLLIAVLVFALFLLLWPRETPTPAPPPDPTPSPAPVVTQEPQSVLIPPTDSPTTAPVTTPDTPIVIVTPSPLPSAAPSPVIPSTPNPSPGAVAVVTPSPTPGPDYLLPGSDSRYLTTADLSSLTHEELCFARNEIFARHGRIFKTPQLAAYFNTKSWYHGTISPDKFDESVLNKYEWANVNLIR